MTTNADAAGTLAENNADFAFALHRQLDPKANLFCSPYSLSSALAMAYAGAAGKTKAEMAEALHFKAAPAVLHASFKAVNEGLNAVGKQGAVKLSAANALWGQKDARFKKEFLALCARFYGGGMNLVDFRAAAERARDTINAWVEEKTAGKIKDIIPTGALTSETRLVITNAVYFKGDWDKPFDKAATSNQPFHKTGGATTETPFMTTTRRLRYAELPGLKALELPYKGKDLAMLLLLPAGRDELPALEKQLSSKALTQWSQALAEREVEVHIPKFKLETAFSANQALAALGMATAFDPDRADFSGMSEEKGFYIGAVLHKAFVAIDEKGTEAAAATAVMMVGATSIPPPPPVFRADHPFLFLIRDTAGNILFLGRLAAPQP